MAKKKQGSESLMLSDIIIKALQEKKGIDISRINLAGIPNSITDYFVVCTGNTRPQVESLADEVMMEVKKAVGLNAWHKEGFENSEWVLLDYFDVVVHIFQPEARQFYQLEKLWADAPHEIFKA